ncbi:ImmA/IrrE family metallo-endopeptidase [Yangia mangrovi]|uniref:ImmA/IrrE family metallo-endopeptidase n=1 Tax=Alloyangia mangrovi TaxID=1779329 RepID=A0A2A3JV36_9RHOB|nr:ImmA/IrrE family metallo-endopeptidase [Alloyangia mangrovi]MCT4372065.1 ImmA/IrrE family metallo-endopeptidase [Alloyangia mangrovi]
MSCNYLPPIPLRATKPSVWAFAEKQRAKVGLSNGFDLHKLVSRNGGIIEYIGMFDEDQTDAIVVEPDNSFVIHLSSETGVLRDNFTIAHELGHLLLHWPKVRKAHQGSGMRATRWVDESERSLVRCEWEANWFASAFLMPEAEFRKAYKEGVASETFGVTQAAVEVRAKTLGIDA